MVQHFQRFIPRLAGSWLMAALFAIAANAGTPCVAHAQVMPAHVSDYRPVFQECRNGDGTMRIAIRSMKVDGAGMILAVDPAGLADVLARLKKTGQRASLIGTVQKGGGGVVYDLGASAVAGEAAP